MTAPVTGASPGTDDQPKPKPRAEATTQTDGSRTPAGRNRHLESAVVVGLRLVEPVEVGDLAFGAGLVESHQDDGDLAPAAGLPEGSRTRPETANSSPFSGLAAGGIGEARSRARRPRRRTEAARLGLWAVGGPAGRRRHPRPTGQVAPARAEGATRETDGGAFRADGQRRAHRAVNQCAASPARAASPASRALGRTVDSVRPRCVSRPRRTARPFSRRCLRVPSGQPSCRPPHRAWRLAGSTVPAAASPLLRQPAQFLVEHAGQLARRDFGGRIGRQRPLAPGPEGRPGRPPAGARPALRGGRGDRRRGRPRRRRNRGGVARALAGQGKESGLEGVFGVVRVA